MAIGKDMDQPNRVLLTIAERGLNPRVDGQLIVDGLAEALNQSPEMQLTAAELEIFITPW